MGYKRALEEAGAQVYIYKCFGSYQGDWLAKVRYDNQTFWTKGSYGSCSGCDAYQAEFGWDEDDELTMERLAIFGKKYLAPARRYDQEEIEKTVSENISWDSDAEEMLTFVRKHAIKQGR